MEANEWISKNDKLLPLMKEFISEIEQLERLSMLFRKGDEHQLSSGNLQRITKQISRSKGRLEFLNDAYDEAAHKEAKKNTSAFVMELQECIDEIKYLYKRVPELKIYFVS